MKKYRKEDNWFRRLFNSISSPSGSRRKFHRDLQVTITREDVKSLWGVQDGLCYYTGVPMSKSPYSLFSVSVDRKDSKLGYTKENIVLVCKAANLAKSKHSESEFCDWLNAVQRSF